MINRELRNSCCHTTSITGLPAILSQIYFHGIFLNISIFAKHHLRYLAGLYLKPFSYTYYHTPSGNVFKLKTGFITFVHLCKVNTLYSVAMLLSQLFFKLLVYVSTATRPNRLEWAKASEVLFLYDNFYSSLKNQASASRSILFFHNATLELCYIEENKYFQTPSIILGVCWNGCRKSSSSKYSIWRYSLKWLL